MVIDDQGEPWEATDEEIAAWARGLHPGEVNAIDAVVARGFIHIWNLGRDVVVSLWPALVNPVTMAGAMYEIARLNQEWTIVCSLAPGGKTEWFRGHIPAIRRIDELMAEAGRVKAYPDYAELIEEAQRFARAEPLTG